MRLLDTPSPGIAPHHYCGLTLMAITTWLEAEAEPELGQLAVAYVIRNRARLHGVELHNVIFGPDGLAYDDGRPWEPFSCWNDDYRVRARARIAKLQENQTGWENIYGLAAAAWWRLRTDPGGGADHYLNVELTKTIRGGTLPGWFDETKITLVNGQHTFLRLGLG